MSPVNQLAHNSETHWEYLKYDQEKTREQMVNYVFMEYSTAAKTNVLTAGDRTDGSRTEEQQAAHINRPVADTCGTRAIPRPWLSRAPLLRLTALLRIMNISAQYRLLLSCSLPSSSLVLFT